jgi:hypothetical protein
MMISAIQGLNGMMVGIPYPFDLPERQRLEAIEVWAVVDHGLSVRLAISSRELCGEKGISIDDA